MNIPQYLPEPAFLYDENSESDTETDDEFAEAQLSAAKQHNAVFIYDYIITFSNNKLSKL
jgi:hypothetical protein